MAQKLDDIKMLVSKDRKTQFIIIAVLLCVGLVWMTMTSDKYAVRERQQVAEVTKMAPRDEHLDDFVKSFRTDLNKIQKDQIAAKKDMQELGNRLDVYEQRTSDIFKKILEKISDLEVGGAGSGYDVNNTSVVTDDLMVEDEIVDDGENLAGKDQLESFFDDKENVKPVEKDVKKKVAFVAPGDTVRVKLLGGVNAPTDGTPYPVIFKLISHVAGPDNSQLPLGEARLIAAAQGSIVDQRALFRLTKLSIRLPNGERKVVDVDGWIVGEDGIRGLKGILIDPIGKAIAGGMMIGGIAGAGEAISDANSTVRHGYNSDSRIITGDTAEYALGEGLSRGSEVWTDVLKDRLKEMVPVVQILSGREATATFANEVTIEDLYEQLEDDNTAEQYSGLD
ncbi:MAG: TrbI/VirB10 family protein [Bdellovibrionota bacterium]